MLVNYCLYEAGAFHTSEASDLVPISQGIHAAVGHGLGQIRAREGKIIDLQFENISDQAQWLEVVFKLGAGDWLTCSRFFFRMQAATDQVGAVSLALRLHEANGFKDFFAPEKLRLSAVSQWVGCEIIPPSWVLQRCVAMDVHLFLPLQDGGIQIHDFGVTAGG